MKPLSDDWESEQMLAVSVAGDPKSSKTHFLFTAPQPIFYHQFDLGGLKRVRPFLPDNLKMQYEEYPALDMDVSEALVRQQSAAIWKQYVASFKESVHEAAKAEGTVGIDTETIMWDIMQYAKVPPEDKRGAMKYGPANESYRAMINYTRDPAHPCNLVLIHQMRERWGATETGSIGPTGVFEPAMHKHVPAQVDVRVRTWKPTVMGSVNFRLQIIDSGVNPKAEGTWIDPAGDPNKPKTIVGPVTWDNFRLALGV